MSPDISHLTLQHVCSLREEQRHTVQYYEFREVIPYFKYASFKQKLTVMQANNWEPARSILER